MSSLNYHYYYVQSYYYVDLFIGILIVGKNYCKCSAAKDQQLSVEECRLKLLIPTEAIIPVDALY